MKNRTTAFLLCFFLGVFGAHRFYVRKYWTGAAYVFTLGLCGFGVLIDLVMIILGIFTTKECEVMQW